MDVVVAEAWVGGTLPTILLRIFVCVETLVWFCVLQMLGEKRKLTNPPTRPYFFSHSCQSVLTPLNMVGSVVMLAVPGGASVLRAW